MAQKGEKIFFWEFFLDSSLLDIPKNRFDRFGPTFLFFKYLLYLNICGKNRNAIKFSCSGVRPAENNQQQPAHNQT